MDDHYDQGDLEVAISVDGVGEDKDDGIDNDGNGGNSIGIIMSL